MSSTTLTVGTILARLGNLINDNHAAVAARWTDDDRRAALREAVCQAKTLRPTEFSEDVTINLVTGSKQKLPDGYQTLLSIDCNSDGSLIGTQTEGTDDFVNATSGLSIGCTSADAYSGVRNARVSDTNPRSFFVEPPVPDGAAASVTATAVASTGECLLETDELPCSMESAIIEWVLYRLYSHEDDSQFAARKADAHYQTWASLMGIQYQFAQRRSALADGIPIHGSA